MFSLEMVGHRPAEAESYYSVAVRDPYTLGRLDTSDIFLKSSDVSRQHATVALIINPNAPEENKELFDYQRSPERRQMLNGNGGSPDAQKPNASENAAKKDAEDEPKKLHPPVMLSVTNFSKFGTTVNGHNITGCVAVESGDVIGIGTGIELRATYRPVVVTLSHSTYSPSYVAELSAMLQQLGATVLESPSELVQPGIEKKLGSHAAPIAQFHLAEEIDSSTDCLSALTLGFSIVAPAYVFEFFASLAENPRRPVHQLPAPVTHAVPVNRNHFPKNSYLRPESDNCPFSLFPRPIKGAGTQRSRSGLFGNRTFYIPDRHTRSRMGMFVAMCGGKVKQILEDPQDVTGFSTNLAPLFYLVLPSDAFVECMESPGINHLSQDVLFAIRHSIRVIPEHSVHLCLLNNKAVFEHLELGEEELQMIMVKMLGDDPEGALSGSFSGGSFGSGAVQSPKGSFYGKTKGGRGLSMPSNFMSKEDKQAAAAAKLADQLAQIPGLRSNRTGTDPALDEEERDKDSDATPSDIDDQDYQNEQLEAHMLRMDADQDDKDLEVQEGFLSGGAANQVFLSEYAKLKGTMAKNILPGLVRVDDIFSAAKKHRYVAPTSIAFLEDTYTQCEQQITGLEMLSASPEGNRQSQVLQVQWDKCTVLQEKILETLRLAAGLGERQAKRSRLLRNQPDPHRLPAHRPNSLDRGSSQEISPEEEVASAGGMSPIRNRMANSTSPRRGSLREGTRVARYFPPPPVKARIHCRPPAKATAESGDISQVKLFITIMPTQTEDIAMHKKLFLRRYGGPEGEVRFGMWMNSQTTQWTNAFYRALEEKGQTMGQLFS